jgi:putative SOS response-associated peptidase YedK
MCGRYLITSAPEAIRALFRYGEEPDFPARYNIAPTQPVPIVRLDGGVRSFALVRWGFIPGWVKDPHTFSLLINARGETLAEKPAFRSAMLRRRCLFPADGFYEWKSEIGRRRPFCVRPRHSQPVAFAGLWETWMGPNGEELDTACIVTTAANRVLAPIHDRMPVVIAAEAFDLWLDCATVDAGSAAALIVPAPADLFDAYEILTLVNRTANDSPALIAPLGSQPDPAAPMVAKAKKKDDRQGSLF